MNRWSLSIQFGEKSRAVTHAVVIRRGLHVFCRHAILAALLHWGNVRQRLTEPRISVR